MPTTQFNRQSMVRLYAKSHLETDPGVISIHFLPMNASEREIRFIEVNQLIGDRNDASLEPIEFGIDRGMDTAHKLFVLDVTPEQWDQIQSGKLSLPGNWTLQGHISFPQK